MQIGTAARLAYYKVDALEGLLIAKGIIEAGEVDAWKENLIKEENERREAEWREFWGQMEDGDLIHFHGSGHRFLEGTLIGKSKTPGGALIVTATAKTKWGYSKKGEYTVRHIFPNEITVGHKAGEVVK